MADIDNVIAALDARDAPFAQRLDKIGQAIGYGRAIQLLGQMWDDMMQASYPRVGRHQESMHRRSDIEKIEAGEPLARLVTYYRKLGPQGRHTRLMPMGEELENVRAIERDIALYGRIPTKEPTADVERMRDALQKIARNEMVVFDEDEGCDVVVSMDTGEMIEIAIAAIATTKPGA